jgi:predicted transcriptional regulator
MYRRERISMREYKLAEGEARFAELIWQKEPIASPELVKLCEKEFQWKKSTTYTVLKKLCERGIFQNEKAIVTSLISKEEFYGYKSRKFVEESFGGSIPRFLTAFMGGKKLTKEQAAEIRELIDSFEEFEGEEK